MFRPLADGVLVELDEEEGGNHITATGLHVVMDDDRGLREGEVVRVGRGTPNCEGDVRPLEVQPGDRVTFSKWSGTELELGEKKFIVLKESEIYGVMEND